MKFVWALGLLALGLAAGVGSAKDAGKQESAAGIRHSFLALGAETYIVDEGGNVTWKYPKGTRDGWVLANGNVLLAVNKDREFPGGAAVEVTREGKVVFQFKGTQSEVNTVQSLDNGRVLLTEAGNKPRILEVDRDGKVVVEVPIAAQTKDLHLQTRMTRKLSNGNYLVPQLLDKVVREYTPHGKIVREAKTPEDPPECWPFTAIRLPSGNTLVNCTHGKISVEFDPTGKIVWQLSNNDLPEPLLSDPCGAQRLANGNTVIASYGNSKPGQVKLLEVTPDKKVVWIYRDDKNHGIHEVQILSTNGRQERTAMK
jgi:Mala s 1-like protein